MRMIMSKRTSEDVFEFPRVSHYYGDAVRVLFIAAAVLMVVGAPFYTSDFENVQSIIFGVIAIVALAALTNPKNFFFVMADAVASGIGLGIYGKWALEGYGRDEPVAFVLRGAVAVIFLFTFYYSLKTVRAMMLHQVGKHEDPNTLE